jgi:hypothetical protein
VTKTRQPGNPKVPLPLDALARDLREKLGDDPEGLAALLVGDRTLPGLTRPRIAELVERGWAPEDAASLAAEELRRGRVEPDEILLRGGHIKFSPRCGTSEVGL